MSKNAWHEDYWHPDAPTPDQLVPQIPPRPLIGERTVRRYPPTMRVPWLLVIAGICIWAAGGLVIWWVWP